jgi:hypothetical protein
MKTAKVLGLDAPWQQFITSTKAADSPLKSLRGVELALPEQRSIFLLDLDAARSASSREESRGAE